MDGLSNTCSRFNKKKILFLFKSSKELTLVVRSGKAQNSGYLDPISVWGGGGVKADHGRNFHPLADHMTKLREFSAIPFSSQ